MRLLLIAPLAALAACSGNPFSENIASEANVVDTANARSNDTGTTAPSAPMDGSMTSAANDEDAPAAITPPAPGPGIDTPGSLPERPVTADNAQGAANVVQTYYALLEAGRYRQAWRLWGDGGKASGMSADAFAASFAKYREYHANVGAPGEIDAGAGQRYVTVPVKVYGVLKSGSAPFAMEGPVTLHRTADIDGATAEQRSWRISSSRIRPRPTATPQPAPGPARRTVAARYRCADGTDLIVRFDNAADTATLRLGGLRVVIAGQHPASGIWYRGNGYELRGKGDNADLSRPGKAATGCIARG